MASVDYEPRGRGFKVALTADNLGLTAVAKGPEDTEPIVEGSDSLLTNLAIKTLLLSYAANELAYRRSRSPEKRKSHRKVADDESREVAALADLVPRLAAKSIQGWCSSCFAKAMHQEIAGSASTGRLYLCVLCGSPTVVCAVLGCSNHANISPRKKVRVSYCAEHRHEVAGFEKLDARIEVLADYKDLLTFEKRNAVRLTKVTAGTIGAAVVMAPVALLAAPVLGAALGGSVLGGSLTGAAATSHGLAMLGMGSVASGGLGMAGGTMVVTATGTALGGALGATTAAAYASADSSFKIELLKSGGGVPVVFATGFLTEGQGSWKAWRSMITAKYPESPVYQVHWGAKELKDLGALLAVGGAKAAARALLIEAGKKGSKSASIPGLGWVLGAHDVAVNPWTVAKTRAGMTGAALAALLSRCDEGPFVLMGHSLGARVMVSAAQALGVDASKAKIQSMHLLGAAVGRKQDLRSLNDAVSESVYNYWSRNDDVLKWVYKIAEVGSEAAGSSGFGSSFPKLNDRNVSRTVTAHSDYVSKVELV